MNLAGTSILSSSSIISKLSDISESLIDLINNISKVYTNINIISEQLIVFYLHLTLMLKDWTQYTFAFDKHAVDTDNLLQVEIEKSNINSIKDTSYNHFKIKNSTVESINLTDQNFTVIDNLLSIFFDEYAFNNLSLIQIIEQSNVTKVVSKLNEIIVKNSNVQNLSGENCLIKLENANIQNLHLSDKSKIISDSQISEINTITLESINSELENLKIHDKMIIDNSTVNLTDNVALTTVQIKNNSFVTIDDDLSLNNLIIYSSCSNQKTCQTFIKALVALASSEIKTKINEAMHDISINLNLENILQTSGSKTNSLEIISVTPNLVNNRTY